MPGKHKTPLLGWHPRAAETARRLRTLAAERGVPLARILDEATEQYLKRNWKS